jgi:DNA replication protein DnaC
VELPPGKTFDTLDDARWPRPLAQQVQALARGASSSTARPVLAFGLTGVGESRVVAVIGHALVSSGCSVLSAQTHQLVQELLATQRDCELPRARSSTR